MVRAVPVYGDVPEEEDRDRERAPVFGGEESLVVLVRQTSGEARRPFAAGVRGDREVAK